MTSERATLHHVHDPMCSWCWAFRPASDALFDALQQRPVTIEHVLGGLAPDSDEPMAPAMAQRLQATWQRIQQVVPGTEFDYAFWSVNQPRRSTWPACRAVIAAVSLGASDRAMTDAIQRDYYTRARNPSDRDVLIEAAVALGLDREAFSQALGSPQTERALQDHFARTARLGVAGFPSLVLEQADGSLHAIPIDLQSAAPMVRAIDHVLD